MQRRKPQSVWSHQRCSCSLLERLFGAVFDFTSLNQGPGKEGEGGNAPGRHFW